MLLIYNIHFWPTDYEFFYARAKYMFFGQNQEQI